MEPDTVLDGGPHTGRTVDLRGNTTGYLLGGYRYVDSGQLHRHEQHGWVRWFRLAGEPGTGSLLREVRVTRPQGPHAPLATWKSSHKWDGTSHVV